MRRLPTPMKRALGSRLVQLATTPHGPEPYLQMVNPLWSLSSTQALLVERRRETHDVTTLVFDPGPDWDPHEAGQHVRIDIDLDGRRHTRSFTISSAPSRRDGLVTLTVKAHPDGHVSRFLHTHARPGLVVELSQPRGEFVLPSPRPDRLLLVSGGSGIAPTMSMLRALLDEGYHGDMVFLHSTRTPDDRIFAAELDRLVGEHDHLTLANLYSDQPAEGDEPTGHLEAAAV